MKVPFAILAGLALLVPAARATVTFDFIFDGGFPISVSSDGSVVVGNDNSFTSFRWTQATGLVSLGRPQTGGGGGLPAVSADGTRIGYSIGSLDNTYRTQGRWTLGTGWQELMPPSPPDGGIIDGSYGSTWDISGDGNTVVGLYWRAGQGNRAHASKWTQATGVVDLGGTTTGQASRANGVNHDASVIAGWVETPHGNWRPAAWVNGSLVLLTDFYETTIPVGQGEAKATSTNGDIIVGFATDEASQQRAASMWRRTDGVFGPTELLGWVDGTEPGSPTSSGGINIPWAVSDDGSIVVGYCSFDGSPFNPTGFVWTPGTGVVDVNQYLADNGVLVDPNFTIQNLSAMTPDGVQIFGYGQMLTPPYTRKAFRITLSGTVAVPPAAPMAHLELAAPIPNPSSSAVRLDLTLDTASSTDLSVFDTAGRRVATLLHADLPPGRRSVTWDGHDTDGLLARAGLYFARLTTERGMVARPLVRVR
jgi:uncharacterized membrane protein